MEIFTDGARINFPGKTGTRIYLPDSTIMDRILVLTSQEDNPTVLNYTYNRARQLTVGTNVTIIGSDHDQTKITGIYLGESDGRVKILVMPDNNPGEGIVNSIPVDKFSYKGTSAYITVPGGEGQTVQISMITTDIFWGSRYQVSINDKANLPTTQGIILTAHITNRIPVHFSNLIRPGCKLKFCTGSYRDNPLHAYDSNYNITECGHHEVPIRIVKFQSLGHILCFTVDLDHHRLHVCHCETIQVEAGSQPGYMDILTKGEMGYRTVTSWLSDQTIVPMKEVVCGSTLLLLGNSNAFELILDKQPGLTSNIAIKILPNKKGLVPSSIGFTKWDDGTTVSYYTVGNDKRVRISLV